jgi:hypothetical protein
LKSFVDLICRIALKRALWHISASAILQFRPVLAWNNCVLFIEGKTMTTRVRLEDARLAVTAVRSIDLTVVVDEAQHSVLNLQLLCEGYD